jgi:chemotaxis protein CheZ
MGQQRKIFRIEETAGRGLALGLKSQPQSTAEDNPAALAHAEIMQELGALRALLTSAPAPASSRTEPPRGEITRLATELHLIHSAIRGTTSQPLDLGPRPQAEQMTRIALELEAVLKGSEQATQKILAAAEDIDQAANNLSAALKGEIEQGLAQDIGDRVIEIFEACNFQDLTSQRVVKVMATLDRIEGQITRALAELAQTDEAPIMHGPRLDTDGGHVTQHHIDSMFATGARRAASGRIIGNACARR